MTQLCQFFTTPITALPAPMPAQAKIAAMQTNR